MPEIDYYDIYHRMSPFVESYLDRYPRYPWQGALTRAELDRMVRDVYEEASDQFPDIPGLRGKKAHAAQLGTLGTLTGLVLLGSLYRRYPYYHPSYGAGYGPGFGYGPPVPGYGYGPGYVPIYPGEGGAPLY